MFKLTSKPALFAALAFGFISSDVYAATEWNVSLWSKRRAFTEHVEKLAELVSAKTNGEFKLNISYGGLSKNRENLDGIAIGAFEMAQFCSFYHTGKNPTITVTELPFAKNVSLKKLAEISQAVYKHPIVVKDLARWNATLLMPSPLPQYNIIGVGDMPKTLEDFDGKRLRGPGGIANVLAQLGAVKTGVAANEVRQALDSGVIDTVAFAQHAHLGFGSVEAGKWATTNLNLGTADCPVVVNTDALNGLSASNKEALLSSVDESLNYYVENYENNVIGKYDQALIDKKITPVTFTDAQVSELNKMAESVRQDWVKKYAGQFDSQALFDFTLSQF